MILSDIILLYRSKRRFKPPFLTGQSLSQKAQRIAAHN
jgi:hypothetical protein